jgi:hypothetical protein
MLKIFTAAVSVFGVQASRYYKDIGPKEKNCKGEVVLVGPVQLAEITMCSAHCLKSDEMKNIKHWFMNGHDKFDTNIVRVNRTKNGTPEDSSLAIFNSDIYDCIEKD